MINSDARNKMTQLQAAFVLTVIGSGISLLRSPMTLVTEVGQWGWMTALPAAAFFFTGAYLIIRLMNSFPGKSIVEFLPTLIGKLGTHLFIWFLVLTLIVHMSLRTQSFGREISFFLFDRTPLEVIIMTFLLSASYAATQDWGALLRLSHLVGIIVVPVLVLIILAGALNFHFINLFPLWPEDPIKVVTAIPKIWDLFTSYELLLVLFPLIVRPSSPLIKYMAVAFLVRALLMILTIIITVGVLTAEGVKNTSYPTLLMVRLADLPGTFIERLDNYLLLSWIPIAYLSVGVHLFCVGKALAELYGFSDHRPFTLAILPFLFVTTMGLHDLRLVQPIRELGNGLGLFLTFVLVPSLLFIKWLKDRRNNDTPTKPM